ncbi:TPA: hypothetical protein U1D16_000691 [Streptococcus suis]|nr:hypothetical protein [Streptococcus suis]
MENSAFNKWSIIFFYISMSIYPLSMVMATALQRIGYINLAGKSIFFFYALVYVLALVIILRFPLSLKRLTSLYFIYILYIILFLTSNKFVRNAFTNVGMVMIYTYYLPYAVLILSRITDFSYLLKSKFIEYTNYFIIISAFIVKYVFHNETNYMPYSYNLLPIWLLFIFNFIYRPNLLKVIVALIMLLEGVIYGARGPLIWLATGGVLYLSLDMVEKKVLSNFNLRTVLQIILSVALFSGVFLFLRRILGSLQTESSYILNRINQGIIGESSGRNFLIEAAVAHLKIMGGEINGIFFDRTLMPDGIYVHNFILETYLSFGWVLGTIILLSLIYFIGTTFFVSSQTNKKIIIFVVSAFFLKYFVTGTMYGDYGVIIMLSIVYAVNEQEKRKTSDELEMPYV